MIFWNSDLAAKISCTPEEMASLPGYIEKILNIADQLSNATPDVWQEKIRTIEDPMLRYGLALVGEGFAGETLEEICAILLYVSAERGYKFLVQCVAAEAVLGISNGDDRDTLLRKLLPYCGIDKALAAIAENVSNYAD